MNELAVELNRTLEGTVVSSLLSDFGRRFYFPKGIVAQSAEAKKHAHRLNATIGMATLGGEAMHLPLIKNRIQGLTPNEIFAYASTAGVQELREAWKREMLQKNPSLAGKPTSLPVVVAGLTHGIALVADLFADPGDTALIPDLFWGNYRLIFEGRLKATVLTFPFFDVRGALNLAAMESSLEKAGTGKVILLLNFPNNPTGYSPTAEEAKGVFAVLRRRAEAGQKILAIFDDAYFGLFYEDSIYLQSLFAEVAGLHENILAVKVDGPTKENLVWGFRIGFVTFAAKGLTDRHHEALLQKVMGAIRSSVSNSNQLGQNLLLKAMQGESYQREKGEAFETVKKRYRKVRELVAGASPPLKVLPFNSGYFMSFAMEKGSAEALRQSLLMDYGVGTISIQDKYLRVAYSSVDLDRLDELFSLIFQAAEKLYP